MTYTTLCNATEMANLDIKSFFLSTRISYSKQKQYEEENKVPMYIASMLMSYIERCVHSRGAPDYNNRKEKFLTRATTHGYKIKDGFVVIPIIGGKDFSINSFECQFVKVKLS